MKIGHVIAERDYTCFGPDGERREVSVRVGQPRQDAASGMWTCAFSIRGLGTRAAFSASGRDGVQALLRGLARARVELLELARAAKGWSFIGERFGLPGDPPPKPVRLRKAPGARWPGLPGQPRPSIPARAQEKVIQLDEAGMKAESEFWLDGERVGRALWSADGAPMLAAGYRKGVLSGFQIEYHDDGSVSYAEPHVDGLPHGWAKQYDRRGRLLLASPFVRGTGIDYWCDDKGRLSEEHPMRDGKPSGVERWWSDEKTVFSEDTWLDGAYHGVSRRWTGRTLDRGYPKFFLRGKEVSRRAYLLAARSDASLPPYRSEDDAPDRTLPQRFLELRQRVRRKARAQQGT